MAKREQISLFGQLRPTGADRAAGAKLRALAGLSDQAQSVLFERAAKKRAKEGALAGAQTVERDEEGQVITPELEEDGTIFGENFNKASILAHRAQIGIDTKAELDRIQNENKLDPEAFKNAAQSFRAGTLQGMPEELAVIVGQDIDSSVSSRLSKLNNEFFKRQERQNQATFLEGLESATDDILNSARDGDELRLKDLIVEQNSSIDTAVEAGLLDPVKAGQIKEDVRERITQQETLREVDEVVFAEDLTLEEKVIKGAEFVNSLRTRELKDLSPEQKDSLVKVVGGKVADLQRQLAQETTKLSLEDERRISNLKVSARQGFEDSQTLIEKIETEFNNEKISGNERTSLLNDVFSGNRKQVQKLQDFSLVAQKLTGNFPEIVLQQKTIDAYYDEVAAPQLQGIGPAEKVASQAQYISTLKAVPTTVKREIANNLLSGDSELIVQTADLINRIDEIPGLQDLAVNANQRAFVENVVDLSVSMEPEQATQLARELTDPRDKARVEARESDIKSEKMQEDYSDWVEDGFESFLGADFLTDNVNKEAVEVEFKSSFEAFFKAGMGKERAKEKSIELLQRNWKESQFGFMKYPPEQYYQVGANTEYMRNQLAADITKDFIGVEFDKEDLFLLSDEKTGREAAQGKPTYQVMLIDSNGEFQRLKGRWSPDIEAEQQRQIKENEERAKGIRKRSDPFEFTNKVLSDFTRPFE